ncbi:unnamed protein product [Oncorhynchus mykiss]|uniref:Uncharacterized protein n=1 Tax=Oncorhynchus mykiss TaxID=8022 RepID=A0A060WLL7_ONCMY|nr:unnamed protein product [Oncorhynchus mykiss]
MEMSTGLDLSPNKQHWWRLEKKLSSCPNPSGSDVELSEESDSALHPDRQPGDQDRAVLNTSQTHISTIEQDLQAQLDVMMQVLNTSDEVEQLVLRNTGLTDALLLSLAAALKRSPSESLPFYGGTLYPFSLLELDIGGNGLSSNGLRMLTSYMRLHSRLQYLGLARTTGVDLEAWRELFDSLKGNVTLSHIILDESNLGDQGARLFSDTLRANQSLRQVDLDSNGIGEVGGSEIIEALLCRTQFPLRHLSLEGNGISTGLMGRIQQEVRFN